MATDKEPQHARGPSFHVNYSQQEISQLSKEIHDETIADVHLSLFTYWVGETREHYEQAKKHIRELALDQGYSTSRIENTCLRKLLDDTYSLRPKYEHENPEHLFDELDHQMSPISESAETRDSQPTYNDSPRAPTFTSVATARGILLPRDPESSATTKSSSPWRSESRANRIRSETTPWSTVSPTREFPPNTPDRPAPLKIRTHGSSSENSPAPASAMLRSVSTPVRMGRLAGPERAPYTVLEATATLTNLSLALANPGEEVSEYESAIDDTYQTSREAMSCNSITSSPSRNDAANEPANATLEAGIEVLQAESNTSLSDTDYTSAVNSDYTGARGSIFGRSIASSLDAIEDPFGSVPTRLSTVSQGSMNSRKTATSENWRSSIPSQQPETAFRDPRSRPFDSTIGSDSGGDTEDSRILSLPLTRNNNSLPLRRFNDSASISVSSSNSFNASLEHSGTNVSHLTIRARRQANRREGNRPRTSVAFDRENDEVVEVIRSYSEEDLLPSASNATRPTAASRVNSNPTSLDAMWESNKREASQPTHQVTQLNAPESLFRTASTMYLKSLLERTRARAVLLPIVDRSMLTPEQNAWMDTNRILIEAIYGRHDIVLNDQEKTFVERIAGSLGSGMCAQWVHEIFTNTL